MESRPLIRRAAVVTAVLGAALSLGSTGAFAQFDVNRLFDFGNKLYQEHLDQQRRLEEDQTRQRDQALPPAQPQQQYPQQQYPQQRYPGQEARQPAPMPAPQAPAGPTRAEVREVQDRLNRLGYDAGPADGLMGPRTASAIEAFQRDNGLPASGAVSDSLLARLQGAPAYAQDAAPASPRPPRAGPGILPVEAVYQDGHLLTGYPLQFGSHRTGETAILGPRRTRSHVELSRVLDLLILAARPAILDDQLVARNYAVRFLTEDEQKRFLADCPYGSCGGSRTPFVGWIGANEFEREATYRRFVSAFRDRLVAPAPPPPLLHVVEMNIGAYDAARESFPLDVRRGDTIIATVPPAYRLRIQDDFARPVAVPVPRAEGGAFLARVPERRVYLALKGTLTPFSDSRYGQGVETSFAVRSAALYADPELRDELHSFGLFNEGGKAVAAAQTSGAGGTGANGMRAIAGPGGEAMLELALPQGLNPLRFMALHGLPVTGAPVGARGALSPDTLKQLHGHAPEIETSVARVVDLLRVAEQPKLLEGLTYAEDFIDTHADADTYAHFYPAARIARGSFHTSFGRNEFERADLHREVIRRYADAAFPKAPFELLHVAELRLRSYDNSAGRYGLSDPFGGGSGVGAAIKAAGFMPDSFPIAPDAAQALIDRIPNGKVYAAYHVALTGASTGGRRNSGVAVALRGLSLYEDERLGKPLHTFKIDAEATPTPQKTLPPMAHLAMHLASLQEVRDIKGWMSDKALMEGAARLVQSEQHAWRATDKNGGGGSGRCRGDKMTVFEWDRARREAPDLANGPLLDALIGVPMDWGFLNDRTRFGLVPDHCVAVHVFPRDRIEGREPEFAARDVLDIYRASIQAAADRAPRTVYISERLPEPRYDHASGELYFPPKYESDRDKGWSMRALTRITAVAPEAEAGDRPSSRVAYVPPGMDGNIFYRLGSIGDTETIGDSGIKPAALGQGEIGGTWRQTVWSVTDDRPRRLIALDRVLDTPRLPMPAAQAEKIIASRDGMTGIITLDIDHAQASPANGGSMIVARLRDVTVIGKEGIVATVPASAFTSGQAVISAARQQEQEKAAAAAAKRKAEETLEATRAALLDGRTGTLLIRRAGTDRILTAYHTGGSAAIGYSATVRDKNLDLPAEGVGMISREMADKLRSEDGAALVVDAGVFGRSVFPEVADLDLRIESFPPEPKPMDAALAAALEKHLPEGTDVVLVRPAGDTGAMETVYTTTSHTRSAHLNWKLNLGTAPDYAEVETVGTPQEVALRDVPDLLRDARDAGILMEADGLRAIYGQVSALKPTIVRFPVAEYGFGLEKDHTGTAADFDILGIAGGTPEAAALAAIAEEFKPEEIRRDDATGEIFARRGACDGPLAAPPAPGQDGAYCLRVRLEDGAVSNVTLRQVLSGSALDVAEEAFKERYGWTPFVRETRYFPGNGQRILVGYGGRLLADRQALGRVTAGTPPTALEAIAWAADGMTAVLLHLDMATTPQEAEAKVEPKPKLKF